MFSSLFVYIQTKDHFICCDTNPANRTESESIQSPASPTKKRKMSYAVYVPPKYFKKISTTEKSAVYQCLMGCTNKNVTVSNQSLCNARRHVEVSFLFAVHTDVDE